MKGRTLRPKPLGDDTVSGEMEYVCIALSHKARRSAI
jgi:hypothetical protein